MYPEKNNMLSFNPILSKSTAKQCLKNFRMGLNP